MENAGNGDGDAEMTTKIEDLSYKIGELNSSVQTLTSTVTALAEGNTETHGLILGKLDEMNSKIAVQENELKHCIEKIDENKRTMNVHIENHPDKQAGLQTNVNTLTMALILIWEGIKLKLGLP